MFIRNNLLKSVNEDYYRYFQDTDMKALREDFTFDEVEHNLSIITLYDGATQEQIDKVIDLYQFTRSKTSIIFLSKYANELSWTQNCYQTIVAKNIPRTWIYKEVVSILTSESDNSCLVGGFIRDAILSLKSKDIDFATDIPYKRLKELFTAQGFGVKEKGEDFLVMKVSKNDEIYDVANFRFDSKESADGRHPDSVEVGDIKTDSRRRDFTINSLYYNLTTNKLIDPTGNGIDDIGNNLLRFVGNPSERIREDYLRTWRAFRLAKTKGLKLERKTEKALRAHFDESYKNSNTQRVLQEMIKMTS